MTDEQQPPQQAEGAQPAGDPYPTPQSQQPYPGADPHAAQQPYPGQDPYAAQGPYADPYAAQQPYPGAVQPYAAAYPPPAAPLYASPTAPYGVDPATGLPWSDKSRSTAGLLQLLLPLVGVCGVGRLYAGQTAIGLMQLLGFFLGGLLMVVLIGFVIAPAVWLWAVVDGIVLLASGGRDQYGRPLR